jgi:hypothetical protein
VGIDGERAEDRLVRPVYRNLEGPPSSVVDTENRIISAQISHFTKIGPVACTSTDTDAGAIKFTYKNIISNIPTSEDASAEEAETETTGECANDDSDGPEGYSSGTTASGTYLCLSQGSGSFTYSAQFYCNEGKWESLTCDQTGCDSSTNKCKEALPEQESTSAANDAGCSCGDCTYNCRTQDGAELIEQGLQLWGYFNFTLYQDGNSCVMEKEDGDADITVEILCSAGDSCAQTQSPPLIPIRTHN